VRRNFITPMQTAERVPDAQVNVKTVNAIQYRDIVILVKHTDMDYFVKKNAKEPACITNVIHNQASAQKVASMTSLVESVTIHAAKTVFMLLTLHTVLLTTANVWLDVKMGLLATSVTNLPVSNYLIEIDILEQFKLILYFCVTIRIMQ